MKFRIILVMMLCFVLLFSECAFAEGSGSGWFQDGWNWITGVAEHVKTTAAEIFAAAGDFATAIKNDPDVQAAWNTLKEGAAQAGTAGKEAVTQAYHTVLNWWLKNGQSITSEIAAALDEVAKTAGVEQADIAEWFSTVEEYIAENKDTVSQSVKDAWQTIKEAGTEVGTVAGETLKDAYRTVQEWLNTVSGSGADNARNAFGKIVNL